MGSEDKYRGGEERVDVGVVLAGMVGVRALVAENIIDDPVYIYSFAPIPDNSYRHQNVWN